MTHPLEFEFDGVEDKELIAMRKLLETKSTRVEFATKWHRNTSDEPMDFENYPHVRELYNSTAAVVILMGSVQCMKALPDDAVVRTPSGWRPNGLLKAGDVVSTPNGKTARIKAVSRPFRQTQLYKFALSDGRVVESCVDHLWKVLRGKRRKSLSEGRKSRQWDVARQWEVLSTGQILEAMRHGEVRFTLPVPEPCGVQQDAAATPLDPYFLGLMLGDGEIGAKFANGNVNLRFTSVDQELVDAVDDAVKVLGLKLKKESKGCNYFFRRIEGHSVINGRRVLYDILQSLGLVGAKCDAKFIPDVYKNSSSEDRLAVLQGILDTDGAVGGGVSLCVTSRQLVEDVRELVWSLGGMASKIGERTGYYYKEGRRVDCKECYTVRISLKHPRQCFRLRRKRDKLPKNHRRSKTFGPRITKVEKSRVADARCIVLDDEQHLYMTNDYLVTHNSEWAIIDHFAMAFHGLSVFFVVPKYDARTSFVQNRIDRCVENVPHYKAIMGRGFFDSVVMKSFGRGVIKYVGSNVLSDFKEYPADCLTGDSVIWSPDGDVCIEDIEPGTRLWAFNDRGRLAVDRVRYKLCRGMREAFEIKLVGGGSLRCTANERFFTDAGWMTLEEIIGRSRNQATSPRGVPVTDGTRHVTRGRNDVLEGPPRILYGKARREAGGVLPTQGGRVGGLHKDCAEVGREQGVGEDVLHILDTNVACVRLLVTPVLRGSERKAQEASIPRVARDDESNCVGVFSHGRRKYGLQGRNHLQHAGFHGRGSVQDSRCVEGYGLTRKSNDAPEKIDWENVLRSENERGFVAGVFVSDETVCTRVNVVQVGDAATTSGRVFDLRQAIHPTHVGEGLWKGVPQEVGPAGEASIRCAKSREETEVIQGDVLRRCREKPEILPEEVCQGYAGSCEKGSSFGETEAIPCEEEGIGDLIPVEVECITFVGWEEVWDIQTEKYHTFFANGIAVHNCLYIDEIDECDKDNVNFALDRLKASKYQFKRYLGNPKQKGSGIHAFFMNSDQREWDVPCDACGEFSDMDWFRSVVRTVEDREGHVVDYFLRDEGWSVGCRRDIRVVCPRCGEGALQRASKQGRWVPRNPGHSAEGYHISMLCSPINSVSGMWKDFREAVTDPGKMQRFYNSYLGLPYTAIGNKITEGMLDDCVDDDYEFTIFPDRAHVLADGSPGPCSMGVDVGGALDVRVSFVESRGVRRAVFVGKVKTIDEVHDLIERYGVERVVIDSMPEITLVQDFQETAACDVWLSRYRSEGSDRRKVYDTNDRIINVDRTEALDRSFAKIRARKNVLPINYASILGGEFVAEMCGPVREIVETASGTSKFEWTHCKDHARHADAYDLMAAELMEATMIDDVSIG